MWFPTRFSLAALIGLNTIPFSPSITPGFPYGSQKVRGVNLGGWLVLEPWITPSLFDNTGNDAIVDEWTFCQYQDYNTAHSVLRNHWDTWITENDFIAIANAGLNHVRLPIGYWAFDVRPDEPYIQGQVAYLKKAVHWAGKHGLKLIVDLHGAPGSQNGYDNSGYRTDHPTWFSNQTHIRRTNNVIKILASMFVGHENVVPVIAALNEPAGYLGWDVVEATKQYWLDSYVNIRYPNATSQQSNIVELVHDAFLPLSYWKGWQAPPDYQGVAMDTHIYQVFSDSGVDRTEQEHIDAACETKESLSSFHLWIIVGEWTPAMADCAKYVNGRGRGSRYEGTYPGSSYIGNCTGLTGSASSFSPSYKTFLRKIWEAQVISYEKGDGWVQWTWKAEIADEWSYQAGLANGWIPQDPTNLRYPDICR